MKDAERIEKAEKKAEEEAAAVRPTDAARAHGNVRVSSCYTVDTRLPILASQEPSRGAKIDEQLELEEEAELKRKGKA